MSRKVFHVYITIILMALITYIMDYSLKVKIFLLNCFNIQTREILRYISKNND